MTGPGRPRTFPEEADQGSVAPLVIGMMLILLVLGMGVAAAGSAFLAGQRLQNVCDGAAAVAGNARGPAAGEHRSSDAAVAAANSYLQIHAADVAIIVTVQDGEAQLTCSADAPITFGALFGAPTLHRTVTATSHPTYRG